MAPIIWQKGFRTNAGLISRFAGNFIQREPKHAHEFLAGNDPVSHVAVALFSWGDATDAAWITYPNDPTDSGSGSVASWRSVVMPSRPSRSSLQGVPCCR